MSLLRILALVVLALTLPALPLAAQDPGLMPLTPDEFGADVSGQTVLYAAQGQPYGAEYYYPDGRVLWAFQDGSCDWGKWYAQGAQICFVYEGQSAPGCWITWRGPSGLVSVTEDGSFRVEEIGRSPTPPACPGPEVGS